MEWLYLFNVMFIFVSGYLAIRCFNNGNPVTGYMNLFASALNAALVAVHFI
jgi:hypothetical protein